MATDATTASTSPPSETVVDPESVDRAENSGPAALVDASTRSPRRHGRHERNEPLERNEAHERSQPAGAVTRAPDEGDRLEPDEPDERDQLTPDEPDKRDEPAAHKHAWFRYTLPGAWMALGFACLSFTPTLLPRPGFLQGFVCGVAAAVGYGLGVVGAAVWRAFPDREARPGRRRSWAVFVFLGSMLLLFAYLAGRRRQGQLRDLMGVPPEQLLSQVLLPVVGVIVFVGLVGIARLLRALYRWLARFLGRWIGPRAARAIGWVLVAALTFLVITDGLFEGALRVVDSSFSLADEDTTPGVVQPTTTLRSGGPGSLVAWEDLGTQGRDYIGSGPSQQEIASFWGGAPAEEPIRTYAGIESEADAEGRAAIAVEDLLRVGGFDRKYLLVVGTTGTGWVDPASIDALEYETRGDLASVAIQYSYLPSWVSFLVDQDRAREAGRALFDEVYQVWSELPADDRPQLLFFGVSLGSFSGETAFSGAEDLANRTDGVLFAGPPNFNHLRGEFEQERDPGSMAAEPVFREGDVVRFSPNPSEPIEPTHAPWGERGRVLYLMHASDPVAWWSLDLIYAPPDWVREQPGQDVLGEMIWVPFVTFFQVTIDMFGFVKVPSGHGHDYAVDYVDGWAAVIQPAGWTPELADRLRDIVVAGA